MKNFAKNSKFFPEIMHGKFVNNKSKISGEIKNFVGKNVAKKLKFEVQIRPKDSSNLSVGAQTL